MNDLEHFRIIQNATRTLQTNQEHSIIVYEGRVKINPYINPKCGQLYKPFPDNSKKDIKLVCNMNNEN